MGDPLRLSVVIAAHRSGSFSTIPVAVLYRADGVTVSAHIGERENLELAEGERRSFVLDLGPLPLGDGRYVFSVALYRKLAHLEPSEAYDLLDRSFEFNVIGNPPLDSGLIRLPGEWTLV